MDWIYSTKTQVSDVLLKLQMLEMFKEEKHVSPSKALPPRCILVPLPSFPSRHRAQALTRCALPVWFPGSLYWLHIKPNVHFAINIARGLRDARQPLFNQCFCFTTRHAWWYWKEKPIKGKINLVIKQNTLDCWLLTLASSHLLRGQNRTCLLSSSTKGFLQNKDVLLWMIKMSSLANGPGQSSITAFFNPNLKLILLSSRMAWSRSCRISACHVSYI